MSSQKTSNNDSCRDLSGRRLSTIKEAKRLAEYIESEPARKKAQQEAQRAKIDALEKQVAESVAGKKHRFDDTEYLEQSRDIVENVKSAVSAGLLKKRKKAKTSHSPPASDNAAVPSITTSAATAAIVGSELVLDSATPSSTAAGLASA
ncbi:Telomere maintenance protein SDE2 [Grifola frondosa]|uniref:Telomere maintenance protein SDE2 n=1 Tax=Grifola frondosa TaxID=5627 RepID=A0A1C7M6B2_GRIFR|nr:Telomere maintenance protein SDE2 [Grifola frondosa]